MGKLTRWSQEESNLLKEKYNLIWKELLFYFPNRSRASIYPKIIKLGLERTIDESRAILWSLEQKESLKQNFGKVTNEELERIIGKKYHAIEEYARKRGFKLRDFEDENGKTINNVNKPTLSPLLKEDLQSYYWIGYLMADGYMHDPLDQIVLASAIKDKEHLEKYAAFLQAMAKVYKSKVNRFRPTEGEQVRVSVADISHCKLIKEKFDWKFQKTYNPPSVDVISKTLQEKEKFLAYFIGFCDGDGYVSEKFTLKLENHKSWETIYNYFYSKFKEIGFIDKDRKAIIGKRGYSVATFSGICLIYLKKFIVNNNLIVLDRKWSRIDENTQKRFYLPNNKTT